jgi:hypothetical protein
MSMQILRSEVVLEKYGKALAGKTGMLHYDFATPTQVTKLTPQKY